MVLLFFSSGPVSCFYIFFKSIFDLFLQEIDKYAADGVNKLLVGNKRLGVGVAAFRVWIVDRFPFQRT